MANKLREYFVQEFVIGLGLLSGMGVDFNSIILSAVGMSKFLVFVISLVITIISLFVAFSMGGWIGIVAVFFAFIGGIFISSQFGIWMLVIGIIFGLIAPNNKN